MCLQQCFGQEVSVKNFSRHPARATKALIYSELHGIYQRPYLYEVARKRTQSALDSIDNGARRYPSKGRQLRIEMLSLDQSQYKAERTSAMKFSAQECPPIPLKSPNIAYVRDLQILLPKNLYDHSPFSTMKKLFKGAKSATQYAQTISPPQVETRSAMLPLSPSHASPPTCHSKPLAPPTPLEVIRYRYHHGTNLGSLFVLERWLTPSMFAASCDGSSELAAVRDSVRVHGYAMTKARWEEHWTSLSVSGAEFQWLVDTAKCTSIRLPVGYWTLGEEFCMGTPFGEDDGEGASLGRKVYGEAWSYVKGFVRRARKWGIGVLVDFHALPGGANADAHSGTGSGRAEFWERTDYRDLALQCIRFMVTEFKKMESDDGCGVIGLQIVNEAVWDAKGLYEWYEKVLSVVAEVDTSIPVYVSDGWDLGRALKWMNGRKGRGNPIVVDTHKYYTFSDKHRSQTPAEIIDHIPKELSALDGTEGSISSRAEAQVIVGEYSCVLDGQTWARVPAAEKEGYVTQLGHAQSSRWQERAGGAYFWTLKMDWMDGGEWGFMAQVKKGNIIPPASLLLSIREVRERASRAQTRREELAKAARASHEAYWSRTCPGQRFEHERYSRGWEDGFSDALAFFLMRADGGLNGGAGGEGGGGNRIGCVEIWVKKRLLESGQAEGGSSFAWEWEHGFRAGVKAFNEIVGI